jgi:hypothetical protein
MKKMGRAKLNWTPDIFRVVGRPSMLVLPGVG